MPYWSLVWLCRFSTRTHLAVGLNEWNTRLLTAYLSYKCYIKLADVTYYTCVLWMRLLLLYAYDGQYRPTPSIQCFNKKTPTYVESEVFEF